MKAKKIIMFIIAVAALCCMFSLCACDNSSVNNGKVKYEKYDSGSAYSVGNFEYSKSEVTSLDIDWIVGDVTLVQSDAETLKVTESAELTEDAQVRCFVDRGELKIKFWKSGYKADVSGLDKSITVEIPKGLTEVDVENINGSVIFETLDAAEVKIETVSGTINAGAISSARDVDLETVSGNIDAELVSANEVDIETVSGSVTITLLENLGATIDYDKVSGSLTTQKEYTKSGKNYVFGSGACRISVESVSGTLTVK